MAKKTKSYGLNNPLQDVFPEPVKAQRTPTANDKKYEIGQIWVNQTSGEVYALTTVISGIASWSVLGNTSSDLDTLTGDTGGPISPTSGNINILGGDGLTMAGSGNTLTINRDAQGGYPITPYVVGPVGKAGYQTIQSALDAANAVGKGTVYIREGLYTENLTLYNDVHLVGASGDDSLETIEIVGQHTFPTSGSLSIKNLFFQFISGAGDIFTSPASTSTDIIVENCKFELQSGYSFNLSNIYTGNFNVKNCLAISTNDGFLFTANNGNIRFKDSELGGLGLINQLNINTANSFSVYNCIINSRLILGAITNPFEIDGGCVFRNTITGVDPTFGSIQNSVLKPSSGAALAHLSSATIQLIDSVVDTPNIPAISGGGSGILEFANLSFLQDSSIGSIIVSPKKNMSGSFETGNRVNYLRMIDNKFEVDGSLVNIDVEMTPKGTGSFALKSGDVTIEGLGNGLNIKEGANGRMGTATLVAGTVVVNTTAVTANSRIFLTNQAPGGTTGFLWISARTPATSFTITSSSGTDTSTVAWTILEPA